MKADSLRTAIAALNKSLNDIGRTIEDAEKKAGQLSGPIASYHRALEQLQGEVNNADNRENLTPARDEALEYLENMSGLDEDDIVRGLRELRGDLKASVSRWTADVDQALALVGRVR